MIHRKRRFHCLAENVSRYAVGILPCTSANYLSSPSCSFFQDRSAASVPSHIVQFGCRSDSTYLIILQYAHTQYGILKPAQGRTHGENAILALRAIEGMFPWHESCWIRPRQTNSTRNVGQDTPVQLTGLGIQRQVYSWR